MSECSCCALLTPTLSVVCSLYTASARAVPVCETDMFRLGPAMNDDGRPCWSEFQSTKNHIGFKSFASAIGVIPVPNLRSFEKTHQSLKGAPKEALRTVLIWRGLKRVG